MPPSRVHVVEVGPRDGLQNEAGHVPVAARVALIEALAAAGLRTIEAGSFVSPRAVPQMADTDQVLAELRPLPGVALPVLVPNLRGLDAALRCGVSTIAIFAATTESFSARNLNGGVAETMRRFADVGREARAQGVRVRGYVSCAVHCPYEGAVAPERTTAVAAALTEMGCYEISLCDTTGAGTPNQAQAMIRAVERVVPMSQLAVHFHDTYGQALANTWASLEMGVATVDSSVAGLGGCPFAPGAAGNLATEDLLYLLHGAGIETGVDLDRLAEAGRAIMASLGRNSTSRVAIALATSQSASSLDRS